MTIIDKLIIIENLGYKYNPITGDITSPYGKIISTINDRYKCIRLNRKGVKINVYHHQYAYWSVYRECPDLIDHKNRNRLDNRICNLRESTPLKNGQNIELGKGYSYIKGKNIYQARIKVAGKLISLGYYKNENDARAAYLKAKKKYHSI